MSIDPSRVLKIYGSPWKMLGLGVLGVGMTALSLGVAVPLLPNLQATLIEKSIAWFGTFFFGACTLLIAFRGLTSTGPIVILTPTGIRDTRLSAHEIPWSGVQNISTWSFQGQRTMVISVPTDIEASLGLSSIARWTRKTNRALGADGLCIASQGLKIDYDTLIATTMAYAAANAGTTRTQS